MNQPVSNTESPSEPTESRKRLQEWEIAILRLDKWEQDEIKYCVEQMHRLLRKYHSSAALAVVKVSLEIAVQKGL